MDSRFFNGKTINWYLGLGILGMGRIGQKQLLNEHDHLGMVIHYFNRSRLSKELENRVPCVSHDDIRKSYCQFLIFFLSIVQQQKKQKI